MKEKVLHMQTVLQYLHQNWSYARFFLAISRFWHDIGANYGGFCPKATYLMVKTSHSFNFDAEKWFFCANATSDLDPRVKEPGFRPYLYSQPSARWRLI